MPPACGIDFGTSNSSVGIVHGNSTRLVALQADATAVPTALFFSFEDNSITFGRTAVERYLSHESGRFVRAIKSLLGTALFDEQTTIRFKSYSFSTMISQFIGFLRTAVEHEIGTTSDNVVMGRPVYFVDDDEEANNKAQQQLYASAQAAGFKSIEFQYEPIAAALNYEQTVRSEELALVADIGGGTSDFSVVRVSPDGAKRSDRRRDILSFEGVHIGGNDFDRLLSLRSLMPHLGYRSRLKKKGLDAPSWYFIDLATWHRINFLYEPKVATEIRTVRREALEPIKIDRLLSVIDQRKGHELLGRIEAGKVELTAHDSARLHLGDIGEDLMLAIERSEFEAAIDEGLDKIQQRAALAIEQAGVEPNAVNTVFLTGGSSSIPALQAAMKQVAPDAKIIAGDAFGSVASGLALDAQRRFR